MPSAASTESAAAGVRVANPILPGFHPDPSIIRVGQDYYLATSTFEWWPGIRFHHSQDLIRWKLIGHALTRPSQFAMAGTPDSGGIWAPALSHADGRFWMTYSDVKGFNGHAKDVRNYLVTATDPSGPWSDPVPLNASGFDPSLFHDVDGRKWLLCQIWSPWPGKGQFAGISMQEYDAAAHRLIGQPRMIFRGTERGCTEGPHLYRKDGYYYLVTAEGGTGFEHAVTVARSRTIDGPYEIGPASTLLTAVDAPDLPLQKAGHASLVETPAGEWFMVHLCSRPQGPRRRCVLGRETALQSVQWLPGEWPRLTHGSHSPADAVIVPGQRRDRAPAPYLEAFRDEFDSAVRSAHWSTLRSGPTDRWLSLSERPGWLRLRGRHSLLSTFDQSLVGFRLLHHHAEASTLLDFKPSSLQQSAGLVVYYNTRHFHALLVTGHEAGGREIRILSADNGDYQLLAQVPVPDSQSGPIELMAEIHDATLHFSHRLPGGAPVTLSPTLDMTVLSDDRVIETGYWGFTGTFVALCAQDSTDQNRSADFNFSTTATSPRPSSPSHPVSFARPRFPPMASLRFPSLWRRFLLASLTIVGSLTAAAESAYVTRVQFNARLEPGNAILHGAGQDPQGFNDYRASFDDQHQPAITMTYIGLTRSVDAIREWGTELQSQLESFAPHRMTPQIGLSFTGGNDDGSGRDAEVAAGDFDAQIEALADAIGALQRPVFLRIGYEFDGRWNNYTPATFVATWKRITTVLRERDLPVATVWCTEGGSAQWTPSERLMSFYPGDEWVDWWGSTSSPPRNSTPPSWVSFSTRREPSKSPS